MISEKDLIKDYRKEHSIPKHKLDNIKTEVAKTS
jgi:hypothetical protein